jgi:4,5-DOPA dioxygenase extradiol
VEKHADYALAVPTPEHFLPLAYLAGVARAAGQPATAFAEGGTMGSLTMTSYLVGEVDSAPAAQAHGSQDLPDPRQVPPEQTNI